ncbi:GDSL-like lipase acylhydrolase protein [Rutstroemia sp. NJR-2017a BVV2]|nr:GDSL-like lipase acylhydrolase protein [Rutstroemia sp. NJR-2017a BVV2]PQE18509.1 GDSL-like lipase acylhydrolase protein [Rutstroemia sp. NJR-2017a BVV2]
MNPGFPINHPYAIALSDTLRDNFPHIPFAIDVQGLPGDQVVSPPGSYLPRLDILYEEADNPYNWMIILGGTNDLNQYRDVETIFEYLTKEWNFALSRGTQVLALTVPECGACDPILDTQRDYLNNLIRSHKAENFHVFDLHKAMPYWSMPEEERGRIWIDGVHFTEEGYDRMGTLIGAALHYLMTGRNLKFDAYSGQTPLRTEPKTRAEQVDHNSLVESLRRRISRVMRSGLLAV